MYKRWFTSVLVVLLVAAVMVGCGSKRKQTMNNPQPESGAAAPASASPQPAPAQPDRTDWPVIVAFGDSLTAGLRVEFDRNYPSQLQEELDRLGYKYRVVNAGISGDTSAGGLARVDTVLMHKPEIVILELGANDGLRGLDVDEMRKNLSKTIERLQAEKVQVVLAGMQIPPNYGPDYTAEFQQTFMNLAEKYKLPLIPFFLDGVAAKPELNQADGVHPTAEGYVYVVRNVLSTLEPLLKK